MGLFSYFRDRRARESAIPAALSAEMEAAGQVADFSKGDARNEIFAVLRQHGLDPEGGGGTPSDPAALQADIFAALGRAGLDLGAMGVPPPATAPEPGELPEAPNADDLRRNPDLGVRNPLRSGSGSGTAAQPADLGEVAGLIAAALAQGNVTVSTEGKVIDLRGTGLHGQAFEPIELSGEEPDPPDPNR